MACGLEPGRVEKSWCALGRLLVGWTLALGVLAVVGLLLVENLFARLGLQVEVSSLRNFQELET